LRISRLDTDGLKSAPVGDRHVGLKNES